MIFGQMLGEEIPIVNIQTVLRSIQALGSLSYADARAIVDRSLQAITQAIANSAGFPGDAARLDVLTRLQAMADAIAVAPDMAAPYPDSDAVKLASTRAFIEYNAVAEALITMREAREQFFVDTANAISTLPASVAAAVTSPEAPVSTGMSTSAKWAIGILVVGTLAIGGGAIYYATRSA